MGAARFVRGRGAGFTIVEIVITAGMVCLSAAGLLQLFVYCLWQAESSGNMTAAVTEAHGKLEEVRSTAFDAIVPTYGAGGSLGDTFTTSGIEGVGVIYLDTSTSDLIGIEVVISWRDRENIVAGEDQNLNGTLDVGEDANGNGKLDSPAALVTLVARRR